MGNCQKNYEIPFLVDDEYNLSFDGLNRTQANPAQKLSKLHQKFFHSSRNVFALSFFCLGA